MKILLWSCCLLLSLSAWTQIDSISDTLSIEALQDSMLIYQRSGNYSMAERYARASLSQIEKKNGTNSEHYSKSLQNVAVMVMEQGRYDEALHLLQEALRITQATLGKTHRNFATQQYDLGRLYVKMGDYEKALPAYLEAKEVLLQVSDRTDTRYRLFLNSLAVLYANIGQLDKAIETYEESLDVTAESDGKEHYRYAIRLMNLSDVYNKKKEYKQAAALNEEALSILGQSLGKKHPYYGICLNNVAYFYDKAENYERAETYYQQSLAITAAATGKNHVNYASTLMNLANLKLHQMQYDSAEIHLLEALRIFENNLSTSQKTVREAYQNLAMLYQTTGQLNESAKWYARVSQSIAAQVEEQFDQLSEEEQLALFTTLRRDIASLQSFVRQYPEQQTIVNTCYDNALLLKGLLLNNQERLLQAIQNSQDAKLRQQVTAWEQLKSHLAKEYSLPLSERSPDLDSLQERTNQLESELARASSRFKKARQMVDWQDVQQQLQADEAAIEFSRFRYYDKARETDSVFYVAYLLRPDEPPVQVQLFEEQQLQQLLDQPQNNRPAFFEQLYAAQSRGLGLKPSGQQSESLYQLIWTPLDSLLHNVQTIHYAPAGLLHRVALPALFAKADTTLADRYTLHYLGSTRQLVRQASTEKALSDKTAWVYGGVFYDADSLALAKSVAELEAQSVDAATTSIRGGGANWPFLKGTNREALAIQQLLESEDIATTLRKGYEATEESFKSLNALDESPFLIHLATHGYFFPDTEERQTEGSGFQTSENPMIRSGLILAGANRVWNGKTPLQGFEDGILTAYEIAQLKLEDTQLVVLSACETGLGDITGNEGVFGLQRAFKLAGVDNLIMSLWQVPDFQTQELMRLFYEYWLDGQSIHDAFYAAHGEMRQRYENPYFWAGFVLVE